MDRPRDERAERQRAERFRDGRVALSGWLRALLGPQAVVVPVDEAARAALLHDAYRASERAAEGQDWALARQCWPLGDLDEAVDALHRLSTNLGARPVWLIVPARDPQACALVSDAVLDNPLGFATLAGHELALLDREVTAGLSFVRYLSRGESAGADDVEWELVVWGEPWLSATMRALRGIG